MPAPEAERPQRAQSALREYLATTANKVLSTVLGVDGIVAVIDALTDWPAPENQQLVRIALIVTALACMIVIPFLAFKHVHARMVRMQWSFESGRPLCPPWLDLFVRDQTTRVTPGYAQRVEIRRAKGSPEPRELEFGCSWIVSNVLATMETEPLNSLASDKKDLWVEHLQSQSFAVRLPQGFPEDSCVVLHIHSEGPALIRRVWTEKD